MRRALIIILFFSTTILVRAQVSVSMYPLNSSFGFRTTLEKITSIEARFEYDFFHSKAADVYQFHPQLIWHWRVASTEQVDYRTGFGFGYAWDKANADAFTLCLPFSINYFPIKDNAHLCFNFECGPAASFSGPDQHVYIRGVVGVTFLFYHRAKKTKETRE